MAGGWYENDSFFIERFIEFWKFVNDIIIIIKYGMKIKKFYNIKVWN